MKNKKRFLIAAIFSAIILWMAAGYFSAIYLTRRHPATENRKWKREKESIELITEDKIKISAWYIPIKSDKAVIILPGIGSDRYASISRAEFYIQKGFSVLLPDLRGTGKSEGDIVSFGWHERKDLQACYQFLQSKGINRIAAHGCSLGAATIVYSLKEIKDYNFIVLESCYDNLDNAFRNRVAKFHLPEWAYLPVRIFTEQKLGSKIQKFKPEEYIRYSDIPTLVLAGDSEAQIKVEETKKLFTNCPSSYKQLHIFKGGKHEDFVKRFKEEYQSILSSFLTENKLNP